MTGRAPGPLLFLAAVAATAAFVTDAPVVLAGLLAGAAVLWRAAPRRSAVAPAVALASALGMVAITPFVAAQGDLILLRGPELPVLDTEVTLEELVAGAVSGARLAAVVILIAATLAWIDADRTQALVARLAPRSALVCAVAARLLPSLQRDAVAISEAARLRGARLGAGGPLTRTRAAAPLIVPLLGSSLERSLDTAEAMAARAYGSGPATRSAAPRRTRSDTALWLLAAALAVVAAVGGAAGALAFDPYPRLPSPLSTPAIAVGGAAAAALMAAAAAARRGTVAT